ncbi:MAG: Ig-like domain-containing protein [Clostridia bacterium]|nr:Ig-like domain-containing protein [Clostridia bacterium]
MRIRSCLAFLLAAAVALSAMGAQADIFCINDGVKRLESRAFAGVSFPDGVFLPETLTYIAPDAFGDTVIFGIGGSAAESYAEDNGLEFTDVNITDICVDAPPFVSPFVEFEVHVSAESCLPLEYELQVYKNEKLYYSSEKSPDETIYVRLDEAGLYDYSICAYNSLLSRKAYYDGETEVYEPLLLTKESWLVGTGESFFPIDEAEQREVTLSSESDIVEIEGLCVTALSTGSCVVQASALYEGDTIYTFIPVTVAVPAETLMLPEGSLLLAIGETADISCEVLPAEAAGLPLTWESSDPDVCSVDENGRLTALSRGECVISISTLGACAFLSVQVIQRVEDIRILNAPEECLLKTGDTLRLIYEVMPSDADNVSAIWSSSDADVARVDAETGCVTAVGEGTVRINVCSGESSDIGDYIDLLVTEETVPSISADVPEQMTAGETCSISVSIQPEMPEQYGLTFTSDDPDVLCVTEYGVLSALSAGSAVVRISACGVSSAYTVRVLAACESIGTHLSAVYLNKGMSAEAEDIVYLLPAGCAETDVSYTSDNSAVAFVDESGHINALSAGTANITVSCGEASLSLPVNVVTDGSVIKSVTPASSYVILTQGASTTVAVNLGSPASKYKKGTWYSDDPSTVRVDSIKSDGTVTISALKAGSTCLHVLSSSGVSAEVQVLVNPLVISTITPSALTLTLEAGGEYPLTYTVQPALADTSGISITSDDPTVAAVSADGVIRTLRAGECSILISDANGAHAACLVTVASVPMTSAALTESEITGIAGSSYAISYTYEPANASPAEFIWTSSNPEVADVDDTGKTIVFISEGSALIHGVATDGSGLKLDIGVEVQEIPVRALFVQESAIRLQAGESRQLAYSVYPHDASYGTPVFESSDSEIASVDEAGLVTGLRAGSAQISVSAGHGENEFTRSVEVTVTSATDIKYRALIMGQFTVQGSSGYLPFSVNGTSGVYSALSRSTLGGEAYDIRLMQSSPAIEYIKSALSALAAQADEDDVTFIYMLTHGSAFDSSSTYYLNTSSGTKYYGNDLINDVKKISGHVVLVLCTCHSGRLFGCSVMSVLMKAGGEYTGTNGQGHLSVICSSTDTKSTYYDVSDPGLSYDFFTKAFTHALGWDMIGDYSVFPAADTNSDGQVTLNELFSYTRVNTQTLISSYVQQYGTTNLNGDRNQYPSRFFAEGDENLVIFGR